MRRSPKQLMGELFTPMSIPGLQKDASKAYFNKTFSLEMSTSI